VCLPFSESDLAAAWTELTAADAVSAGRAIWTLVAAPDESVPFLKARLSPKEPSASRPIDPLVAALGDNHFRVRQEAMTELNKLGELAEPALRKALGKRPMPEVRRRIEQLLDRLDQLAISVARGMEVLEHIDNPEARQALQTLARGSEAHQVTRQAKASLENLARRSRPCNGPEK
jgi:hypothetical protein